MVRIISGIVSISGFGGGYEDACQRMLQNGYDWLEKNESKKKRLRGHSYKYVFGLFEADSKEAKELERAVMKGQDGATGAMHQAVMSHLFYIAAHGADAWIEEATKKGQLLKGEE